MVFGLMPGHRLGQEGSWSWAPHPHNHPSYLALTHPKGGPSPQPPPLLATMSLGRTDDLVTLVTVNRVVGD